MSFTEIADKDYKATLSRLKSLARVTTKEVACTACNHKHNLADRHSIPRLEEEGYYTLCPKCQSVSFYDLVQIRKNA